MLYLVLILGAQVVRWAQNWVRKWLRRRARLSALHFFWCALPALTWIDPECSCQPDPGNQLGKELPRHAQRHIAQHWWKKKTILKFKKTKLFIIFNPFLPTGHFIAPKLIILIKCLIDVLFSKCCFNVSLCRTRCEFWHSNHVQVSKIKK